MCSEIISPASSSNREVCSMTQANVLGSQQVEQPLSHLLPRSSFSLVDCHCFNYHPFNLSLLPPPRSDFSLVDGHCFKSLLVGKTNTLNYYQAVNSSSEIQVGGMGVFSACQAPFYLS